MSDTAPASDTPISMSDTPPGDQPTGQGANFTAENPGEENSAAGAGDTPALQPEGGWLAINGDMDLSSCIVGNSGASVSKIYVSNQAPWNGRPYDYCVWVYGQGPSGAASGRLWLVFFDQGGNRYDLSLWSSTPAWHYVSYNSDTPGITAVAWSDGDAMPPPAPAG